MKRDAWLCWSIALAVSALILQLPVPLFAAADQEVVQVKQADDGKTIHAIKGQAVDISLPGNITTGYCWTVSAVDGTSLQQLGQVAYKSGEPHRLGSGGVFTAHFHATTPGVSAVKLIYSRPWEKGTPPARNFIVKVNVEAAK